MWGEYVNLVNNFLLDVIKLIKWKLNFPWIRNNPPTTPPQLPTIDLETEHSAQSNTTAEGQSNNGRPQYHPPNINVEWSLIGVCVAAIGITVQALQTSELLNSLSFHWICMALVFSLTAVMMSIYISRDYKLVSLLVVHVGIFIVFTALVVVLVINIHLPFKVISIAAYLIGILIIIFANLCKRKA